MAKASKVLPPPLPKIDELDWKILRHLDQDASQSLSQIGKKLRTGRDVVHYRVRRLEKLGVIRKYITVIDYYKLGFFTGGTYLKLQKDSPGVKKDMVEKLSSDPNVFWLNERGGAYDLAFGWFVRNVSEVKDRQREIIGKYAKNMRDVSFRLYTKWHRFTRDYLHESAETPQSFALEAKPERLTDETDEKILKILSENARMGYVEIAKKLKMSPAQVHYRIDSMKQKKIILGAKASLNLELLGYERYRADFYLDDYYAYDGILAFAAAHPNSVYAYDATGGADITVEFEVKSYDGLKQIVAEIKKEFREGIAYTDIIRFTKEHKQVYFPSL